MKDLARYALTIGIGAVLLAGCTVLRPSTPLGMTQDDTPPIGAPQAALHRVLPSSASYQLLHHFSGSPTDGYDPQAGLIDVNGTLYGTTFFGGERCNIGGIGCGTVFSLSTNGTEKVLHSFTGGADGGWPAAALIVVNGTLYGTTTGGGKDGGGTVFRMSTNGHEKVLHSFTYGTDGAYPAGPLIDVNGTLYGTTAYGGKYHNGTAYSITTGGAETVLHSFCDGSDGCNPDAGLATVNGILYGTTPTGRTRCCGTVFSLTTNGTENVLYTFAGGSDGETPAGGLFNANGTLYGTTIQGGRRCGGYGCGTAYSITTAGVEQVLHRFTGGRSDGAFPRAGLIDVKGVLYGTTSLGGHSGCGRGCGTIYSLTTSGAERMLYSFQSNSTGEPKASLLNVKGVLYGTTPITRGEQCVHTSLCGTAYALTP